MRLDGPGLLTSVATHFQADGVLTRDTVAVPFRYVPLCVGLLDVLVWLRGTTLSHRGVGRQLHPRLAGAHIDPLEALRE